jgi:hypothetical protein
MAIMKLMGMQKGQQQPQQQQQQPQQPKGGGGGGGGGGGKEEAEAKRKHDKEMLKMQLESKEKMAQNYTPRPDRTEQQQKPTSADYWKQVQGALKAGWKFDGNKWVPPGKPDTPVQPGAPQPTPSSQPEKRPISPDIRGVDPAYARWRESGSTPWVVFQPEARSGQQVIDLSGTPVGPDIVGSPSADFGPYVPGTPVGPDIVGSPSADFGPEGSPWDLTQPGGGDEPGASPWVGGGIDYVSSPTAEVGNAWDPVKDETSGSVDYSYWDDPEYYSGYYSGDSGDSGDYSYS